DVTWDELKNDYDACVLAVGLTEPNGVRAEGEDKAGVLYGLPFLRDIGMGTSTVKLGPRVAVIGGGNTAIDCAREALRQGAVEVTMITVEANTDEMPAVPEDLHDMIEEGVGVLRWRGMSAARGSGKLEAERRRAAGLAGGVNSAALTLDSALRGAPFQPRTIPLDVITDLNRMNMTYFPHFPRVQQAMLAPASRRITQEEVILAFSEEQAIEEANRCFSCGTCNACDNCYLVCPEPCIVRSDRSNGLYKILVDYCKGCRVCIEECPTGCLEGVPELDFDSGVVRMDTAFAITQGLHGRQAEELKLVGQKTKEIDMPAASRSAGL